MDLLDNVFGRLSPSAVSTISRQIGADELTTQKAIAAALPVMVGALARNANRSPQEAASLTQALEKDHDGSLLDQLGGLLGGAGAAGALGGLLGGQSGGGVGGLLGGLLSGGGRATNGSGILGHIFGNKRGSVEDGLSRATGLDRGKVMQLLVLLAPMVMAALGKMRAEKGLGPDGVAEALRREEEAVMAEAETAKTSASGRSMLDFLDRDDDGSIADDVAKIGAVLGGSNLFGRLTGRR